MQEEHREPWEALSLIAAGYLAWLLWHYVITIMDCVIVFIKYEGKFNLENYFRIPFLL